MKFSVGKDNVMLIKAKINADPNMKNVDPALQGYNFFYYITGQPASGKSNLIYNLLTQKNCYKKKFDKIYLFCPSTTLAYPIDEDCIFDDFDEEKLDVCLHDSENIGLDVLFIFDDVIASLKKRNSQAIRKLLFNRRHVFHDEENEDLGSCSIIITSQVFCELPLAFRKMANGIIIFKPNMREYNTLCDEILKFLIEKDDLRDLYEFVYKEPYSFLYVKNLNQLYKKFGKIKYISSI